MFRGYGKRELTAWTVILCLVSFGTGAVLVKRFRPVGPMEFHELPTEKPVSPKPPIQAYEQIPDEIRERRMSGITAQLRALETPPPASAEPQAGSGSSKPHSKAKPDPDPGAISLNSGQLADLEQLPGVGPGIAQRIIDYRTEHGPFQSLDELRNVKGIGEKRFAKMEPFLRL
jgi:comEA protein